MKPGGRVLNHGIARLRVGDPEAGPFSERYVFPDAAPLHLSRIQLALERAGLETEHVEGLRSDYAETLRHWAANIDEQPRRGHPPGRPGADPRVAPLPARRAARLRERLHLDLPGARLAARGGVTDLRQGRRADLGCAHALYSRSRHRPRPARSDARRGAGRPDRHLGPVEPCGPGERRGCPRARGRASWPSQQASGVPQRRGRDRRLRGTGRRPRRACRRPAVGRERAHGEA